MAILTGVAFIIFVFSRRMYLYFKKDSKVNKKKSHKEPEEPSEITKEKLSRADKELILQLCEKGDSFIKSGKEDEAIKCFVQALAIDQTHVETQNKLALLYMQKQMFAAASALFKQLSEQTNDPVHYSHLGLALYNQNDFEAARDAYQKAVELDDSRAQRFVSLAQVYRALQQHNLAIIALKKALEKEEGNLDFQFLLTEILMESGDLQGANGIIKGILENDPKNEEALKMLGEITSMGKSR